jgi:hypothetical protein
MLVMWLPTVAVASPSLLPMLAPGCQGSGAFTPSSCTSTRSAVGSRRAVPGQRKPWSFGLLLLGIALWRSRVAPAWMGIALGLGGFTHPFLPGHVLAGLGLPPLSASPARAGRCYGRATTTSTSPAAAGFEMITYT